MKKCTKCGIEKADSEYSWSILGVKKHSACNSCRALDRLDYYQRNKEKELKYKSERQVAKREEARTFVFSYLKSQKCKNCGIDDPYVLTFHHTGKKKMDISQMVNQGYSIDAIKKEIKGTVVLCANCHMKLEKLKRGTVYI
jgi:hypothetical protein